MRHQKTKTRLISFTLLYVYFDRRVLETKGKRNNIEDPMKLFKKFIPFPSEAK